MRTIAKVNLLNDNLDQGIPFPDDAEILTCIQAKQQLILYYITAKPEQYTITRHFVCVRTGESIPEKHIPVKLIDTYIYMHNPIHVFEYIT